MTNISFDKIREEIIGLNHCFETPYGKRVITYADYTASGKSLKFIEKYLIEIQKYYANTHTEDDITGEVMTNILHKSEKIIKKELNASDNCYVIAAGTGATGAILSFSKITGIYLPPATKEMLKKYLSSCSVNNNKCENIFDKLSEEIKEKIPVVFISPYEHHSNILMWRESLVEVVEIQLDDEGYLDLNDLEKKVSDEKYKNRTKIGSISASSNVTGIKTPVYEAAKILHKNNAIACFDFAASGPYVEINMNKDSESYFDAVFFSPHKFIGGPGSSGILVINENLYNKNISPTVSGGGTVDYVSCFGQDYVKDVEEREKAGTPGILQVIKAALSIQLKSELGINEIEEREIYYTKKFMNRFKENKNIEILGPEDPKKRISIISFMIKYKDNYIHPRFAAKLLNDLFGLQSRAGCACAGPYGHRLLNIDNDTSAEFRDIISDGTTSLKPGWVRVNLHYTMSEEEVNFILDTIDFISQYGHLFLLHYYVDAKSGAWHHKKYNKENSLVKNFGVKDSLNYIDRDVFKEENINRTEEYKKYFDEAMKMVDELKLQFDDNFSKYKNNDYESLRWFYFIDAVNNDSSIKV